MPTVPIGEWRVESDRERTSLPFSFEVHTDEKPAWLALTFGRIVVTCLALRALRWTSATSESDVGGMRRSGKLRLGREISSKLQRVSFFLPSFLPSILAGLMVFWMKGLGMRFEFPGALVCRDDRAHGICADSYYCELMMNIKL